MWCMKIKKSEKRYALTSNLIENSLDEFVRRSIALICSPLFLAFASHNVCVCVWCMFHEHWTLLIFLSVLLWCCLCLVGWLVGWLVGGWCFVVSWMFIDIYLYEVLKMNIFGLIVHRNAVCLLEIRIIEENLFKIRLDQQQELNEVPFYVFRRIFNS